MSNSLNSQPPSNIFAFLKLAVVAYFDRKPIYGIFLLIFLLFTSMGTAQTISFDNTVSPEIAVCSDTKTFSIAFTNNTATTMTNVVVNLQLPSGINYEVGSLGNVDF